MKKMIIAFVLIGIIGGAGYLYANRSQPEEDCQYCAPFYKEVMEQQEAAESAE